MRNSRGVYHDETKIEEEKVRKSDIYEESLQRLDFVQGTSTERERLQVQLTSSLRYLLF